MNSELVKLRYIAPTYLIGFTATILTLLAARWLLSIRFEILDISEDIWELWAPMIVAWLSMYFCLRNRLKILSFEKDSSNRRFAFQFLAWASLFPVLLISQSLLTTSTSRLIQISDIYDINETPKARYYNIEKFKVADHSGRLL